MSIVIVGWRDANLMLSCLASVADRISSVAYEVVLVLNEPSPSLVQTLERDVRGAKVISFRTNLGFGAAVNFGVEHSRGRFVALLNDDCIIEPGWLEHLVELVDRRKNVAIVGSMFLHEDGSLQEAGALIWSNGGTHPVGDGEERMQYQYERRVDYCSGGAILIRRDVWQQLGGLDDRYYPAYFEDVDFSLRAAEAGWEVWLQPLSLVRHVRSASSTPELRKIIGDR